MNRSATVVLGIAAFGLCSGATDMSKFYQPVPHRSADGPTDVPPDLKPSSGNAKDDIAMEVTAGFELVGYSAFNGREASRSSEIKQAEKVGAPLVIYGAKYVETVNTGVIGNTTFNRFGATSFAVPMSMRRYDQIALFFRKIPRVGLGASLRGLSADEHTKLGTNKGVGVMAVVNGSPAFAADVLPGDVILTIDDKPVFDIDSYHAAVEAAYGRQADLSIMRGDKPIHIKVALPAGGAWSS